ncbi:MAG: phage integrase N-terminal SAM-like domain-containing protein [candidate division Zixibacteria bacterium]|nr:phage integrase N-terminal SAM-like domain-containing protein [candidate division Zixibacteria bacterium]
MKLDYLESFMRELKHRERSGATKRIYDNSIKHFYKWVDEKNIRFDDATKDNVKDYLAEQP